MGARSTVARRSLRLHAGPALVLLGLFSAFSGCGSPTPFLGDDVPTDVPSTGRDRTENDAITIDEAKIAGTVEGTTLHLTIPVAAKRASGASGTLHVSLRSVDDATESAKADASYALSGTAASSLTADLPLPSGISSQSDLVRWNVRVSDGAPGGLQIRRSLLYVVSRYALTLEGPATATKGRPGHVRVRVEDPVTGSPLASVPVTLRQIAGGKELSSQQATSGTSGAAVFDVPADTVGTLELVASVAAQGTKAEVTGGVQVSDVGPKILLTTDKPIYQPGQTVHVRTLSLAEHDSKPIANAPALIEVFDGKGNKIVKRTGTTDTWGIASTDVALAAFVNEGTFKIKVTEGSSSTEKTIEVKPYALPKFKAAITTDKSFYLPAQTLAGVVNADYFFGKHVALADVAIEAATLDVGQTVFQSVVGKTDANGRFEFQVTLPKTLAGTPLDHGNAMVSLHVTVTDTAGQSVDKTQLVTVAASPVEVTLVPESTSLVPGVENRLDLFATDPMGTPIAGAAVALAIDGATSLAGTTDAYGHAEFTVTPSSDSGVSAHATVTPPGGAAVDAQFTFSSQSGADHVLVRTDRAVYQTGDTIAVEVLTSAKASRVYVDWLNEGRAVDMRTLDVSGGKASFTMAVDDGLTGSNRIEAYVVDAGGNVTRTGRTVFARRAGSLHIDVSPDQPTYTPGQAAKLTFSVSDDQGQPTVAALGVQIVDEAVFGLVDARPGLLRTYFELEDAFATPQYELEAPPGDMAELVFTKTASTDAAAASAAQARAAASFAALGDHAPTGLSVSSWKAVLQQATTNLAPFYAAERQRALGALKAAARTVEAALAGAGCKPTDYACGPKQQSYSQMLADGIQARVKLWDLWGNAWQPVQQGGWSYQVAFTSRGPDEKDGTSDDASMSFAFSDLGVQAPSYGPMDGAANGGAAGAAPGGSGGSGGGGGADPGAQGDGPRVRKDFPETLYVNPALITGPDGKVTVDVGMADSITEWRVSALANAANGKLGDAAQGVTVFQDFFVDVSFPASLTRGDVVKFPIAVYNYLATPQTVQLSLEPGGWYTPLGPTTLSVDLQPGEVKGVGFPVSVDEVGLQSLVVTAKGTKAQDAVARTVRVVPEGKPTASTWSGTVEPGSVTQTVTIPPNAVPGSSRLAVDVYPAFLSQVVKGMDSMLQVPSGCFEQTTSTTWPNVLVTRYMKQTNQLTTEIELKADSLISAGYQRLLTFEHKTGGFSWFGEQEPAANISVTAFGVLEFVDMSQVALVDDAMLARTVQWLAAQQSADGSWKGEQTEFFDFSASTARNTAFVVAALASAGWTGPELAKGLSYLKTQLGNAPDVYTLAMVAYAGVVAAPNDAFTKDLLAKLDAAKTTDGTKVYWDASGTQTSFYGAGADASITTTGIAAYTLLSAGAYQATAAAALDWLAGEKDQFGNYGSSQATVWALRAMILAASKGTEGAVGNLAVELDGVPFGSVALTKSQSDVTTTIDLGTSATAGAHQVKLTFVGTGKPSFNLVAGWNVPWAEVVETPGPLAIGIAYDKTQLAVNDTVTETVTIANTSAAAQHMALVTLGIPPGFEVNGDDFQDDLAAGRITKFETTARQLILYVPLVPASGSVQVAYRLRATMPVTADDGGGEVHPYYEPSARTTTASQKLTVVEN